MTDKKMWADGPFELFPSSLMPPKKVNQLCQSTYPQTFSTVRDNYHASAELGFAGRREIQGQSRARPRNDHHTQLDAARCLQLRPAERERRAVSSRRGQLCPLRPNVGAACEQASQGGGRGPISDPRGDARGA